MPRLCLDIFFTSVEVQTNIRLVFSRYLPFPLILSFASQMSYHIYDKQKPAMEATTAPDKLSGSHHLPLFTDVFFFLSFRGMVWRCICCLLFALWSPRSNFLLYLMWLQPITASGCCFISCCKRECEMASLSAECWACQGCSKADIRSFILILPSSPPTH